MNFKVGDPVIWTWTKVMSGGGHARQYDKTQTLDAVVKEICKRMLRIEICNSGGKTALVLPESLVKKCDSLN